MSSLARTRVIALLAAGFLAFAVGCSDPKSKSQFNSDTGKHVAGWASPDVHGVSAKEPFGFSACADCHSADFSGGISSIACSSCHGGSAPHPVSWTTGTRKHSSSDQSNAETCSLCHANGANSPVAPPAPPAPAGSAPGCFNGTLCHYQAGHAAGWNVPAQHGVAAKQAPGGSVMQGFSGCQTCHGTTFAGQGAAVTCLNTAGCHGTTAASPHPPVPWRSSAGSARTHTDTNIANATICGGCHAGEPANGNHPYIPPAGPVSCFDNTLCHGQVGHAAGWNNPAQHGASAKSAPSTTNGFSSCQTCHGTTFAGQGLAVTCLQNALCHGATVTAPHSPGPWRTSAGSVRTHTDTNTGNAAVCGGCHAGEPNNGSHPYTPPAGPVTCFDNTLCHAQAGHPAGWGAAAQHGAAAKSLPSVTNMQGFSTCRTCHGANFNGGTAQTCLSAACHGIGVTSPHAKPPWVSSVSSTMTHTNTNPANAVSCGLCHWMNRTPPSYVAPVPGTPNCTDNTLCHGTVPLGCVECHNSQRSAPNASVISGGTVTQRRDIVAEFALTWSHKRSGGGTATNEDCVVCHMEGNATTKARDAAYHGNGYIELRDPDTGTQIQGVTWDNLTPGSYVSSGASVSFVRFSRNLGAAFESDPNWLIDAAIQMNQCLNCHDADGALSSNARVTGGTALRPFNTTITGHTAPFNSNGNGNVVNVNSSFATTNAAYHPVSGKQNNWYAKLARMVAPWNAAARGGTVDLTSWGPLMSCWDCHAPAGAAGVLNGTVTAHGGAATLRAPVYTGGNSAATNLCVICHSTAYATTAGNHGAGSAYATGGSAGNMTATIMQRCHNCHAYTAAIGGNIPTTTFASRPVRAENVHGVNDRTAGTVGSTWGTSGVRPYSFIRNTLSVWAPATVGGIAPPSAHTCTGTGGTCGTDMQGDSYTPGGVY